MLSPLTMTFLGLVLCLIMLVHLPSLSKLLVQNPPITPHRKALMNSALSVHLQQNNEFPLFIVYGQMSKAICIRNVLQSIRVWPTVMLTSLNAEDVQAVQQLTRRK